MCTKVQMYHSGRCPWPFSWLSCSPVNVHRDRVRDVEGVYISTHIGSARLQTMGLSSLGFTVWPVLALCPSRWDNYWGVTQVKQITEEELLDSFWLLESSSPGAFATTSIFSFFLCYCLEKVWHWTQDFLCHWTTSPTEQNEFRTQHKKWRGEKKKKKMKRRHSGSLFHGLCSLSRLQCTYLGKMLFSHPGWKMFLSSGRVTTLELQPCLEWCLFLSNLSRK